LRVSAESHLLWKTTATTVLTQITRRKSSSTSRTSNRWKRCSKGSFTARERANLLAALEKTSWKIRGTDGAAELIGLKPTTLLSRMKRMGLQRMEPLRLACRSERTLPVQ